MRRHTRSNDPNRSLHVTPRSNLPSQGCGEDGRPAPFRRSISQHVGLSSHHYQQLLLLYEIGSSIDRGQAKFALVALGHARHGYIYIYAVRAGLPAAALACVVAGVAPGMRRASCGVAWRKCAALRAVAAAHFSAQLWRRPSRHQVAACRCCACCGVRGRAASGDLGFGRPRNARTRVPRCVLVPAVECSSDVCILQC